jgi:outer membrane protein OmpA-like peptidoglycan-associated protein
MTLTGRVITPVINDQAAQIAKKTAPQLELNNQIMTVKLLRQPVLIAAAVELLTTNFNQKPGAHISSYDYKGGIVYLDGNVFEPEDISKITKAIASLPGVQSVKNTIEVQELVIKERIYFLTGSAQFKPEAINDKIIPIVEFLQQNPDVNLKIIGHTDSVGTLESNKKLGLRRASSVQQALVSKGINPQRLQIEPSTAPPGDVPLNQPSWLSRCVRFEPFLPKQITE